LVCKLVDQVGFLALARRWALERVSAWALKCRRLDRDSEELPKTTEA